MGSRTLYERTAVQEKPFIKEAEPPVLSTPSPRGREALGLFFYGYVPLVSQSPYPIIVYSVANYRPILVTFGQICNFRDPNLVAFFLCIYLILNED